MTEKTRPSRSETEKNLLELFEPLSCGPVVGGSRGPQQRDRAGGWHILQHREQIPQDDSTARDMITEGNVRAETSRDQVLSYECRHLPDDLRY